MLRLLLLVLVQEFVARRALQFFGWGSSKKDTDEAASATSYSAAGAGGGAGRGAGVGMGGGVGMRRAGGGVGAGMMRGGGGGGGGLQMVSVRGTDGTDLGGVGCGPCLRRGGRTAQRGQG